MSREAMKLALEALEGNCTNPAADPEQAATENAAITALRQALETEKQEPVAWMHTTAAGLVYFRKKPQDKVFNPQPVYTEPPNQKAKPKGQYVIFGSGGLAKELIAYIEEEGTHEVVCVVSTEPFNNKRYAAKYPVVESIREGAFLGAEFLLAVADPDVKQAIVAKNEERWATYIHSTATVSPYARIGKGCVLAPQVIVTADAWINDFVFMNTNATVGHDSVIHAWTTMYPNTEVCGDCVIGVSVIMGIGSYVLPGKEIANRVKISAGSIVRHHFKGPVHEGVVLQGNPAAPR